MPRDSRLPRGHFKLSMNFGRDVSRSAAVAAHGTCGLCFGRLAGGRVSFVGFLNEWHFVRFPMSLGSEHAARRRGEHYVVVFHGNLSIKTSSWSIDSTPISDGCPVVSAARYSQHSKHAIAYRRIRWQSMRFRLSGGDSHQFLPKMAKHLR